MEGSESAPETKTESDVQKLRQEMINLLDEFHEGNPIPAERKAKQVQIVNNLPESFWLDYKGHLIAKDYDQASYEGKQVSALKPNEIIVQDNIGTLQRFGIGELFEYLVRADKDICKENETELALVLRQFMANPRRFGIPVEQLPSYFLRNPDIAQIDEKTGKIIGLFECKAGPLDERSLRQLSRSGFEASLQEVIKYFSMLSRDSLEKYKLSLIAKNKDKLVVSPDLRLTLAVPYRQKDVNGSVILFKEDVPPEQRGKVLEDINKRYKVKQSPFTNEDIKCINGLLIHKFREEQGILPPTENPVAN